MKNKATKSGASVALTRRDFARGVAAVAAAAALPGTITARADVSLQAQPAQAPPLSPAAEAQVKTILARYGSRLSEDQKLEVRRLVAQAQKASEAIGAFPLDNSNEPATTFRAYRRTGRRR